MASREKDRISRTRCSRIAALIGIQWGHYPGTVLQKVFHHLVDGLWCSNGEKVGSSLGVLLLFVLVWWLRQ